MFLKWTNYFLTVGVGLVSLAGSAPAWAANCGGATPCDCGDTLTASRTLDAKVDPIAQEGCPSGGLTIGVSGVVLDLGRNKIGGSGSGVGVLIGGGVTNVTIRNGGVDRFETGIGTANMTTGSTIDAVRLDGNTGNGILLVGDGNVVTDILAKRNGDNGVWVIGDNNRIEGHNNEYSVRHNGIFVQGDFNEVVANLASENRQGYGIRVVGNNNTLEHNQITKLNLIGIFVEGDFNTLNENRAAKQKNDGIIVSGDDNVLTDNEALANRGVGVSVVGTGDPGDSTGNAVSNNRTKPQCNIYGVTTPPTCIQK